jgi:hypothetical protein
MFKFPLLTLDESTLFYWTLSNSDAPHKRQKLSAINKWASAISRTAGTQAESSMPRAPKSRLSSTSGRAKTDIPSLALASSTSHRSYAPSVLSNDVKIISRQSSNVAKVKAEHAPALSVYNNGGLSDNDEIKGEEREVAINSPPKGKRRITSEVFFSLTLIQ